MNTALRLTIKQWAPEDRPTERLQRLGAESLTDAELLAILIGSGTQQYSAVDIGNQVLGKFNHNLNTLGKARFDEILDIEGVGTQTACKILAAVEFLPCKRPSAERGKRRQIATPEQPPKTARTSFHRHSGCIKMMRERCAYGLSTIGSSSLKLESLSLTATFTPSVATSIHSISTSVNARVARRPFLAEPPPRL